MWEIYPNDDRNWDNLVKGEKFFPYRQLSKWADYKKSHNWNNIKLQFIENDKIANYASIFYKIFLNFIFIYIPGGPFKRENINKLIETIIKLKNKKYFYIRIDDNRSSKINENIYEKLSFTKSKYLNNKFHNSLRMNLNGDIKSKLQELDSKWRYNYKRSLKNNIQIKTDLKPNLKLLLKLANEMEKNKKIKQIHSISEVTNMLKYFKDNLLIKTAYKNNELIGFRMAFFFKNIAWDIYGASSYKGRKNKVGYRLIWSIIEECYNEQIDIYDLGGIYDYHMRHFKTGISDYEYQYPGEYEKSNFPFLTHIISLLLKIRGTQFLNKS